MKIRTITTGFNLKLPLKEDRINRIASFANDSKKVFENSGYTVQTLRLATQPWEEYFESRSQIIKLVEELERLTHKYSVDYFNVGPTSSSKHIPLVYDIIKNTSNGFCTVIISDRKQINHEAAKKTARLIKKLSRISEDGFDNLRFAALFNTKPGSPFYPASYHKGPTSFAIGAENSDLVYKAFSRAKNIEKAEYFLKEMLTTEYERIEAIARGISEKEKIEYDGIDVSIATSVKPNESIAHAFEKLGLGKFGEVGTLAIAKVITETLKGLDIKKCGYCGLMLPVLEDYGLAMRNIDGTYELTNLLLYSAVCGVGLDTVPLPGDVSEEKLYALLLDIASLSIKLDKPLSARLMPIPNKTMGQMTNFKFEYFVNSKVMKI